MSGKLNTKDIKTGGDGVAKTLQPGNHSCKINSVALEEFTFKPGAYNFILRLEGPDMGSDFEGFFYDKNNEALGRHRGQVAKVKASEYAYADGTTKSGVEISRDNEILKFLKNLCTALEVNDWLVAQDSKHDTIEQLVAAFDKDKPFKDKYMNYCIAGKEYKNKAGYTDYELFLPKYSKEGAAYGQSVVKFNPDQHIKKKKVEPVNEFGNDTEPSLGSSDSAFQLD